MSYVKACAITMIIVVISGYCAGYMLFVLIHKPDAATTIDVNSKGDELHVSTRLLHQLELVAIATVQTCHITRHSMSV